MVMFPAKHTVWEEAGLEFEVWGLGFGVWEVRVKGAGAITIPTRRKEYRGTSLLRNRHPPRTISGP